MTEKFMDLSSYRDLDVKSVKMRSLTGEDMVVAAGRCAPGEGAEMIPAVFSITLRQQQVAQSIIEVDGEPVRGPCLVSLKWTLRTREFLGMIYDSLNGLATDEREAFQTALRGGVAKTPAATPTEG